MSEPEPISNDNVDNVDDAGDVQRRFPVMEIFGPTVQGEGYLVGQMTHFVRFGGCGYRCSWCDSMHAVDPVQVRHNRTMMSSAEIGTALIKLGAPWDKALWVTFSGGDPVMHDLLLPSRHLRLDKGYKIAVETQGQLWKDWLMHCNHVTVSPKPPSSGESEKISHLVLREYVRVLVRHRRQLSFKVVVFDKEDLKWALDLKKMYQLTPFYLSVGTKPDDDVEQILDRYSEVIDWAKASGQASDVRILPQMHVLLWGHKQGV